MTTTVRVWSEELVIPAYLPAPPDRNPMFLEKRVYQGSSGRVYPLPFTDRIAETRTDHKWQAVWLENEYLRVMVLPEIGGRIQIAQDRTNDYDFIYRQTVIKPALVGLAGPWISGGIEFNWPQHHRPATFMPVDFQIEKHADGSQTVWLSDHDPMARMKGMHGVCLHPGKAFIELKVRAYNRTPMVQTFLWWANVAARVHEAYQSFFPPDVHYVADHARRAMSDYPLCRGFYYGVNYGERGRAGVPGNEVPSNFLPPHSQSTSGPSPVKSPIPGYAPNDLSWYANIPTPCSYMCRGSNQDFFGGYDHFRQAGFIHLANHHVAPGKKQWTWGNHEFGYAWDRNLTDQDGPYIELMAGAYTDNQPDFSFLQPGETKSWSQFWYPIQQIGPAQHANLDAAVHLTVQRGQARLGVSVSSSFPQAKVMLTMVSDHPGPTASVAAKGKVLALFARDLAPGAPLVEHVTLPRGVTATRLCLRVVDRSDRGIIVYSPSRQSRGKVPPPATEPPWPADIAAADELYLTGLHLEQYRHATRCPTLYWREALRRDPRDARCNNALGLWHLRRGEFAPAEVHFRQAIARLTHRNANPYDGEPFYHLGLCLRLQLDALATPPVQTAAVAQTASGAPQPVSAARALFDNAYASFYKATWNQAWASAGFHALAELDCRRCDWPAALDHVSRALKVNTDNLRARDLKALILRQLDRNPEAEALLRETLALDPLDWWARHLAGEAVAGDAQARLDIAHDYARAGFYAEAIHVLESSRRAHSPLGRTARQGEAPRTGTLALPDQNWGAAPMVSYTLGWLQEKRGDTRAARIHYRQAARQSPDYCFPSRLEEIAVLESARRAQPDDARAPYYLGNLLYDRRRHREAIRLWEQSAQLDPTYSVVWRNLGIGRFNILQQPARARSAYDRAFRAEPRDARLLYERDQLWKRLGEVPQKRLRELEKHPDLVRRRDDLSVEICALYNQTGQHAKALQLLNSRRFQPWEGGEGQALGQHVRTHLALGRVALARGDAAGARTHFAEALSSPPHLGEAKHLLVNQSDLYYWLGCACDALGDPASAHQHWLAAAEFQGDFQEMRVRAVSEMTYYSALAGEKLGYKSAARRRFRDLLAYARKLQRTPATVDYFATSLPTMLLFDDDLQFRQETAALFLQAQAHLGLRNLVKARQLLDLVLRRDPNHALAADALAQGP